MLEVNTKAPDFALPDQNGQMHKLEEYRGKKVILYFYPRDNTPGCTKQACGFGERYPQIQEKGAVVIGVSKDSVASHKKFEEKYGLPFTLLSDTELTAIQAYDVIISPAKKMNVDTDTVAFTGFPVFMEKTQMLMEWVRKLSFEEAKNLWGCNDKLAELNFRRFCEMDLRKNLTPALISYEGIQYQYMAPSVFTETQWDYVQERLRILSGFYGILKPLDGVTPYRLEMQAKAAVHGTKNLYDFWGGCLCQEVFDDDRTIVNLASKEYSKCIEKYLRPEDTYITCVFGEWKAGRVVQKGTQAKMARGEMVRFMAENLVERPEEIKNFDRLDYQFCKELSAPDEYIFLRS